MNFPQVTIAAGATGFGDGKHPTTATMLAALEGIGPDFVPARALDIGAGSGILSFALAARFGCPVIAGEINHQAFDTLQENITRNGYENRIRAVHADGFSHPEIQKDAPYDLIAMNILAEPLLKLAAEAEKHLAMGGLLLLSGMLAWQEPQIRAAYEGLRLEPAARLSAGDWVTLSFAKP